MLTHPPAPFGLRLFPVILAVLVNTAFLQVPHYFPPLLLVALEITTQLGALAQFFTLFITRLLGA